MGGPSSLGRILVLIGVICIIAGGVIMLLGRFIHLGRLPGDIFVNGEHGSFYFPIVSCILISIVLSIILNIFNR